LREGIAGRHVPWDEDRHLRHDAVRKTDARSEERDLIQSRHDFKRLRKASPTVRAAAHVLAERLYAKSAVLVQQ
jgi:hypothetical protein